MTLTLAKVFLILVALFNLVFISIAVVLGKHKIAIALSVLEAMLVTSSTMFD